jgi:purine-binding chemotaxis protein CheW
MGRLYATFVVGDNWFGVDATGVQEVMVAQPRTRVPLAGAEVRGLINLRGQVVIAIDLRRRLGMPDRADDTAPLEVVVRTEHGPVSLLVDDIGDVLEADDRELAPPPENLTGPLAGLVSGVHPLDDRLLLVLDIRATAAPAAA